MRKFYANYVLDFVASQPTPEQIAEFRPTVEMQSRLKMLVRKEQTDELNKEEQQELAAYEKLEHLVIMLKTGSVKTTQQ